MVARLVGINSDEIDENPIPYCEGRILSTNGIFSRPLDTIKPIPLTPEILEANGFEINENVRGYQYPNDDKIFCLEELSGVFIWNGGYNDIIIEYVHNLQHILRICGLTYLADNFKIE